MTEQPSDEQTQEAGVVRKATVSATQLVSSDGHYVMKLATNGDIVIYHNGVVDRRF